MSPNFDNLVNKGKGFLKQAADQTTRIAKIGKLNTNVMTLRAEKGRHLQTVGLRAYTLFSENNSKIDGTLLQEKVRDEISQIERIETRVREIEEEIADLRAHSNIDVTDVTEEDDDDEHDDEEDDEDEDHDEKPKKGEKSKKDD